MGNKKYVIDQMAGEGMRGLDWRGRGSDKLVVRTECRMCLLICMAEEEDYLPTDKFVEEDRQGYHMEQVLLILIGHGGSLDLHPTERFSNRD